MSGRILFVEDDKLVRDLISAKLENEGYEVVTVGSAKEMFNSLRNGPFDLLLLDLGLPDEDGIALARKIRASSAMPLMILTARTSLEDKLAALEVGADDFLTKSVDGQEFLLRIRNLLARSRGATGLHYGQDAKILRFDGWVMDLERYELTSPAGQEIVLTSAEFNLLGVLAKAAGRVLSRSYLLDAISGIDDVPSDRMIDAFVSRIRKKIEPCLAKPKMILTVTGVGYKFNARLERPTG